MNPQEAKEMTSEPPPNTGESTEPAEATKGGRFGGTKAAAATATPAPKTAAGHRVTVSELNAYYGEQQAVKDLSIAFEPSRVTALIGPSGCGKSTLVRCINRMHEEIPGAHATGQVMVDETDVYGSDVDVVAVRRAIGMVFQKPNPFPTMSIYDNVAAGLRLRGAKGSHLKERVEQSLRSAGLWDEVKDRLAKAGIGLSGGQQQRLCIARTLAAEPEVILMDEPCSALDPTSTRRVEETIAELRGQITIVIVTHNMQQAARVSDQCAFFLATHDTPGHIVEAGGTEQIFERPADPRTADYVNGRFG
jgi:phosphate transport system ATP-binding protein